MVNDSFLTADTFKRHIPLASYTNVHHLAKLLILNQSLKQPFCYRLEKSRSLGTLSLVLTNNPKESITGLIENQKLAGIEKLLLDQEQKLLTDQNKENLVSHFKEKDQVEPSLAGHYIILEGGEASGKSTLLHHIQQLADQNPALKNELVFVREPDGQARKAVMTHPEWTAEQKTIAMAKGRYQLFKNKIEPALKQGKFVISDRGFLSALIYQGIGDGLGLKKVIDLNEREGFVYDFKHTHGLFLDLDPEIGLTRVANHDRQDTNYMDNLGLAYFKKVQKGFATLNKAGLVTTLHLTKQTQPEDVLELAKTTFLTWGLDLELSQSEQHEINH